MIGEAAWAYQRRTWVGGFLRKRQQGLEQEVKDIAWKAQQRLHSRYTKLSARGKNKNQVVTAVGRELLGFIWAIATRTEAKHQRRSRLVQGAMSAIPSIHILWHRRHPSRLPFGSRQLAGARCRSALTGPGGDARTPTEKRDGRLCAGQMEAGQAAVEGPHGTENPPTFYAVSTRAFSPRPSALIRSDPPVLSKNDPVDRFDS